MLQKDKDASLGFVHRFVRGEREETLLALHGTGGTEDDLIPLAEQMLPGANILSPRGKVLENGMPRFFRRLAVGIFDIEDLKLQTHRLADFVAAAAGAYTFDPGKVIAVGYSNGANIAASTLLLRPSVLSAAILFRPMTPLIPDPLPVLADTPVFISAGRQDPYASEDETNRLAGLLTQCGAAVRTNWVPGGHSLTGAELEVASRWVQSEGAAAARVAR